MHAHRVVEPFFDCVVGQHEECRNIDEEQGDIDSFILFICGCPCHDRRKPEDESVPVDSQD